MLHRYSLKQINTNANDFSLRLLVSNAEKLDTKQMRVEAMWGKDPTLVQLLQQHSNPLATKLEAQITSNTWLMFKWMVKRCHVS